MGHRHHHTAVGLLRELSQQIDAVFTRRFLRIDPGVVDIDRYPIVLQFADDIDHPGIAQVGAVFFEGQAKDEDAAAGDINALAHHQLDQRRGDIVAHMVVDTPPGENHFGMVANLLGLVGEVIWVGADAVSADQAGAEREKIPLGAGRCQHFGGVDTQTIENEGEFVDQGDVDIALGVLDDLGRLRDADAAGGKGAGGDDRLVEAVDGGRGFGGGAGGDLDDRRQPVLLVAGIDPLGAVAAEEIAVEGQARSLFEQGDAHLLGGPGIDGGLVDDDVTGGKHLRHRTRGALQGTEIWAFGSVDGRWHGDDVDVALDEFAAFGGKGEVAGRGELVVTDLEGVVMAAPQFCYPGGVEVEADGGEVLAEFHSQGQTDIAETDDAETKFPLL